MRLTYRQASIVVIYHHFQTSSLELSHLVYEPLCEKTGLRGFRPGPTQTGLYSHRRSLEA